MRALYSLIVKELKLLSRDPGGLIMLFVLPAIFIFVLSIALQGTFLSAKKKEKIEILVINNDKGESGRKLIDGLNNSGYFKIIAAIKNNNLTLEKAKLELLKGNYKIAVNIPEDASESLDFKKESKIDIYVDPVLSNDFTANITNSIQSFVYLTIINNITTITNNIFKEIKNEKIDLLNKELEKTKIKKEELEDELVEFKKQKLSDDVRFLVEDITGKNIQELNDKINDISKEINNGSIKTMNEDSNKEFSEMVKKNKGLLVNQIYYTKNHEGENLPNSVQQNVPGWTIFALFWLVQILSINIILERQSGAFKRILMSPATSLDFFIGKTIPYFIINMLQAVVMFCIGIFILPLFGLPKLELKNYPCLILITSGISFASIGMGFLFGSVSKSLSIAASLSGALLIVMTILGGIMVPKFIMPKFMQDLSYFVPHGWALDAYQNILIRDYNFIQILPNFFILLLFSIIFISISLLYFNRSIKKD